MAEIYLARHGETEANAEGRVQGWLDPPLNERGRDQARRLAIEVAPLGVRAIWTSHLKRALETALIVADALGLGKPRIDERFAESRRGEWEGKLLREIERDDPDGWRAWQRGGAAFRFPGGGESLGEHAARMEDALADVADGPEPALVVCHGGSVRCAIACRRPEGLAGFSRIAVPNASVTKLP